MAKLSVTFTGSCGFVPQQAGADSPVRVFLPDGSAGWIAKHKSAKKAIVPPHTSYLGFKKKYHTSGTGREPDLIFRDANGDDYGICRLKREMLGLPNAGTGIKLDLTPLNGAQTPTAGVNDRSLLWVAQMDALCKNANSILRSKRGPGNIAAVVDLAEGSLEASDWPTNPPPPVLRFDPKRETGQAYQQCLASGVRLTTQTGSSVRITSSTNQDLVLDAVNGEIKLDIGNEVLEDFVFPSQDLRERDYDFELLFWLKTETKDVHIPVIFRNKDRGIRVDCKGAWFQPANLAAWTRRRIWPKG